MSIETNDGREWVKLLDDRVCPFCGRDYSVVEAENGDMGVTHVMPTCPMFDSCDVVEYVREVRLAMERKVARA